MASTPFIMRLLIFKICSLPVQQPFTEQNIIFLSL